MSVCKCNDKCYLTIHDKRIYQYVIDQSNESPDGGIEQIGLNKDEPYIMGLTLYRYDFEKAG